MTSSVQIEEQKPLLTNNNNNNSMGKSASWSTQNDVEGGVAEVYIAIDSRRNGLNHREKASDSDENSTVGILLPPPQRAEDNFPPEKWKTFLAFTLLVVNMAWTLTILSLVHERMPDRTKYPPLPDVFFDIFPPVDWALDVSEFIIIASVWLTLLVIVCHKHRFIILRRCFIIISILYFMRSLTMFVTQVPVASTTYYCSPKANSTTPIIILQRVVYMMAGFGLSVNGRHTYCGDYIYSGHTVVLTLAYLVIQEYSPKRCLILRWLVFLTSCTGIFMVLLSRGHYAVDVVIGYYVTTRVFWIYHTIANNSELKSGGNHLSRVWWFSIFMYFERNVKGVVPRKHEWPLPWPRKFRFSRHTRIS